MNQENISHENLNMVIHNKIYTLPYIPFAVVAQFSQYMDSRKSQEEIQNSDVMDLLTLAVELIRRISPEGKELDITDIQWQLSYQEALHVVTQFCELLQSISDELLGDSYA